MKLRFEAKKRQRVHTRFIGVQLPGLIIDDEGISRDLWVDDKGRWDLPENIQGRYSNTYHIRTLKAFKRYIKKLDYLPSGTIVKLISKFINHDVYYTIP